MDGMTIDATDGGSFQAYVRTPSGSGPWPAVLVIQEIFGINGFIRSVVDRYAAAGFLAVAPDLFWRLEPGLALEPATDYARARELYGQFSIAKGVDDLRATLASIRERPDCTGKVGAVGYCLGGRLAFTMATRSSADLSVGYYGVGIETMLGEASAITKPLVLHMPEDDAMCPPEAQQAIHAALDDNPLVTLYDYPGQDHAFCRLGGDHYDAAAAAEADGRTMQAVRTHLAGEGAPSAARGIGH